MILAAAPAMAAEATGAFDYADYAAVLAKHVDGDGLVSYPALKADAKELDGFLDRLAAVELAEFDEWLDADRIALFLNAYNAITLKAIIGHYPIKADGLSAWRFPANSIRQIDGVWDRMKWTIAGRRVALEDIEHRVLRRQFNEPRIHMALVCASLGCPILRDEPYEGARLDDQLADQTRRFLRRPEAFRVDRDRRRVHLSPIFDWFEKDFARYGEGSAGVLSFVAMHVADDDAAWLRDNKVRIKFQDYDWSLNEQPPK